MEGFNVPAGHPPPIDLSPLKAGHAPTERNASEAQTGRMHMQTDVSAPFEIPTYILSDAENRVISGALEGLAPAFALATPAEQVTIAGLVALHISLAAPTLVDVIRAAFGTVPMRRISGLPVEDHSAAMLATALALIRGEIFQYEEQSGGALTMAVEPVPGAPLNSSSSAEPLGLHCDDSIMPKQFRVEEISLLAVHNPPDTTTGFALLETEDDAA